MASSGASEEDQKTSQTHLAKNRLPFSAYIKSHKNLTLSFEKDTNSFQQGQLGDTDTHLVGTLHLSYGQPRQVRSILLHLKGSEKTSWYKAQARSKALYMGEQILVDNSHQIYSADDREIQNLDIPFKFKLPYNLPETITTDIGSISYVLRATVNRKGNMGMGNTQIVEVVCPLKKTLMIDNQTNPPYKLRGESRSGLDYTFVLPPNKNLNLGTYVSIPMRIRFTKPGISVERVEIVLKTCMDFRCNNPNETRHVKEQAAALVIPRQEIRYLPPSNNQYEGECVHTINLFIPRSVQPTYSGRFISITHQLCIKFCLWGADMDFQVEESVRVANILEKHSSSDSNSIGPSSSPVLVSNQIPPPPSPLPSQPYVERQINHPYLFSQGAYQMGDNVSEIIDPREAKLRYLNQYPHIMEGYQQNMGQNRPGTPQPTGLGLQHGNGVVRRPSQPQPAELPPPFPYDGYAENHLNVNNHPYLQMNPHKPSLSLFHDPNYPMYPNNLQTVHRRRNSQTSQTSNASNHIATAFDLGFDQQNLLYRKKFDNLALYYNRPAEPKTPPSHPPPPAPQINSIYQQNPGSPTPQLPSQGAYQNYQAPPPYLQQQAPRQYFDTGYAVDFDD